MANDNITTIRFWVEKDIHSYRMSEEDGGCVEQEGHHCHRGHH